MLWQSCISAAVVTDLSQSGVLWQSCISAAVVTDLSPAPVLPLGAQARTRLADVLRFFQGFELLTCASGPIYISRDVRHPCPPGSQ